MRCLHYISRQEWYTLTKETKKKKYKNINKSTGERESMSIVSLLSFFFLQGETQKSHVYSMYG